MRSKLILTALVSAILFLGGAYSSVDAQIELPPLPEGWAERPDGLVVPKRLAGGAGAAAAGGAAATGTAVAMTAGTLVLAAELAALGDNVVQWVNVWRKSDINDERAKALDLAWRATTWASGTLAAARAAEAAGDADTAARHRAQAASLLEISRGAHAVALQLQKRFDEHEAEYKKSITGKLNRFFGVD